MKWCCPFTMTGGLLWGCGWHFVSGCVEIEGAAKVLMNFVAMLVQISVRYFSESTLSIFISPVSWSSHTWYDQTSMWLFRSETTWFLLRLMAVLLSHYTTGVVVIPICFSRRTCVLDCLGDWGKYWVPYSSHDFADRVEMMVPVAVHLLWTGLLLFCLGDIRIKLPWFFQILCLMLLSLYVIGDIYLVYTRTGSIAY